MTLKPWLVACIAIFAATPALAQSSSAKPLNLNLDLKFTPRAASTTHGKAKSTPASKPRPHGAHPADTRDTDPPPPYAYLTTCNNKAYTKPRVFGGVGLGVFSGSHIEGNYQAGTVGVAKALGSCNHPSGDIVFSFGFERGTINGPFWHR
ncbi:MAG: hypothetical protein ACRD22_03090 [Terriglobia bacterium]